MRQNIQEWLGRSNKLTFAVFVIAAAFITYFSMYAFRKPFTAGIYDGYTVLGMDYKIIAVFTQVMGYTFSKFIGIKVISELKASTRIAAILVLIGLAWIALLFFAAAPTPWNVVFLFFNGLPLGMIWGVVFSFLEGRQFTEILGAGMASSFIVASGVVKAVGRELVVTWGVSEFWMPFATGLLFIPALLVGITMLRMIPPPTRDDEENRTERVPMDAKARIRFFSTFSVGILLTTVIYIALTVFRDIRDNFAVEIWSNLGFGDQPEILATAEIPIAVAVLIIVGLMVYIKNNRTAFYLNKVIFVIAGSLLLLTTWMFEAGMIDPIPWMILNGFSMYLAYIAYHTFLFERWIALFRYKSNIGFLMYIVDAFGYLGSITVIFIKDFQNIEMNWLSFFINIAYVTGMVTIVLGGATWVYFLWKERAMGLKKNEPVQAELV